MHLLNSSPALTAAKATGSSIVGMAMSLQSNWTVSPFPVGYAMKSRAQAAAGLANESNKDNFLKIKDSP